MRILMLGDIVGKVGRDAAQSMLPTLMEMYSPDLCVANGENTAGGVGITPEIARNLLKSGIDVITLGNHSWSKREIAPYLDCEPRVLRPANYPPGTPGAGWGIFQARSGGCVGVANVMGRIFMEPLDDPFRIADTILERFRGQTMVTLFDVHAEATSEKVAFAYYLDGRATAVVGTHTHVQTADERLLPRKTAFISDVGMVGPQDSVLGMDPDIVVQKFITQMPCRFQVAEGPAVLCGVAIDVDAATGRATHIERIQIRDIH